MTPQGQAAAGSSPKADLHVPKRSYGEDMGHLFLGHGLWSPFSTRRITDVQKLDAHRPHLAEELAASHTRLFPTTAAPF